MSFWQILGRFAVTDTGETLQKLSDTTSVSSDGTTYTNWVRPPLGLTGLFSLRWAVSVPMAVPAWVAPRLALGLFLMTGR